MSSLRLEVDHCPGKYITPDALTRTPEAVHKVHADTMYSGHIFPPDYNRSNRGCQHCIRGADHSLMCPTDRENDPTVVNNDETERVNRDRGTESSNRDGNGPLKSQWTLVQNHAERGVREQVIRMD
jgi:hypothetical protein